MYTVGIITISDKGSRGERVDTAGPAIKEILLSENEYDIKELKIISDDKDGIISELKRMSDEEKYDFIFTTGGTGFSPRDNTPEANYEVMTRNALGISEYMRMRSSEKVKSAMLSRGASVIRNNTLIINLPGSEKAVRENLSFITDILSHAIDTIKGIDTRH